MSATDTLVRLRYRFLPDHMVGEILSKRWTDNAIPFTALVLTLAIFGNINPGMFSAFGLYDLAGQISEFGLLAIALTLVMISGGIDLSIGSVFALCALTVLTALNVYGLPLPVAVLLTLAVGAFCGAINGVLIGYMRLRAFLTTLVTLVMFRSIYEMILPKVATDIVLGMPDSVVWDNLGFSSFLGLPYAFYIAAVIAIVWHIVLSRSRPGWHIAAVGGARRSAHNAGINVRLVICLTYVFCGMMVAAAAILFAARLTSVGTDTGLGMEISVLTAVILGGTTLGGGRGSVAKALIGSVIVLIMTNGLLQMGVIGTVSALILGVVLLLAVWLDVRWVKNRQKLIDSSYVSPAYIQLKDEDTNTSVYTENDKLRNVETIGLGQVEGPEDVAVDRHGNVYSGSRHGEIHRWLAPDFKEHEIFAHIGGGTFGMNFDKDDNLVVCVGGMGLYMVTPEREVVKLTDETNRSWTSVIDDSRIQLADDLDIAPDGRVFFSEASIRYTVHDWPVDMIESRGNGRIICYDPRDGSTKTVLRNRIFPNGIVCLPDGESLLFNETWACRVCRYWFDGPNKGKVEVVLDGLPGYPDNINRASDGNYWVCLVGMRGPALDLAMTRPSFRRRMTRRVAPANWIYPNINTGCIIKITAEGEVLESIWDKGGVNHPMVTSCKEHEGHLYIGGVSNNRVGRWKIEGADPTWSSPVDYWGPKS
ncbi:ABC transporter permease [Celeribacter litoreus]|uniref:ABC transporter permease n=1 Tax=Celeribacter litoreus TaxID=2876714 RepID=UPI001CCBBF29|nr:SMP-30/gluconolactonase/LRE family protein [Celeribacter litoreus]MCA0043355.1 SMP-30/gluconolactonase/LRE family protein [Celeribacter litoreus]